MLHSMTGFARQSAETAIGTLAWELRAVNHRYLDLQFRLPDQLRPHEPAFRQQVARVLHRGKIECGLYFRGAFDRQAEMQLDTELVALLGTRIGELSRTLPDVTPASAMDILRWPGVIRQPEVGTESLLAEAGALLNVTLEAVASMRASEGGRIAAMLESRLADIAALADSVKARMPKVLAATRAKQRERIDKLEVEADPARLEIELALVTQKLDVAEEIDRIDSHVAEIRKIMQRKEPVGRRLDFLMQELNREANTLASKSADTETTKAAVELKVLIEQMREQIQNVE